MALPKIVKDIDARVKDTGDTMTGNLIVEKGDYPSFNADNTTTGARANFQSWENSAVVQSQNVAGDTSNRRGLFLKNSNAASSVANALTLRDWVNGTYTEYKLYGTHNKPTPDSIGAASSSHLHDQYYSSSVSRTANTVLAAPDKEMVIMIRHYYNGGGVGVAKIGLRTNNVTNGDASSANAYWMYRYNIGCENLGIGLRKTAGNTLADLYYKVTGGWSRCEVYQLQGGRAWTLINSSEAADTTASDKKGSTEVYTSISDGGSKLGAGYTDIIYAVDGATRPSSSGTSGLTSGSSSLGTGNIYYQYE